MKKRSKSDRSEIARDLDSEQKVETTVEFPEDGRTLFSINSKRRLSRDEFWGKPGRLFSLLALEIADRQSDTYPNTTLNPYLNI